MPFDNSLKAQPATRDDLATGLISVTIAMVEMQRLLERIYGGDQPQEIKERFERIEDQVKQLDEQWVNLTGWTDNA